MTSLLRDLSIRERIVPVLHCCHFHDGHSKSTSYMGAAFTTGKKRSISQPGITSVLFSSVLLPHLMVQAALKTWIFRTKLCLMMYVGKLNDGLDNCVLRHP